MMTGSWLSHCYAVKDLDGWEKGPDLLRRARLVAGEGDVQEMFVLEPRGVKKKVAVVEGE